MIEAGRKARVISIASGKGGVGKSTVAVNLARALAAQGRRVCLLDADLGLANVDILLGLSPRRTLEDVLFRRASLEEALSPVCPGFDVLAGSSGIERLAELGTVETAWLLREIAKLDGYHYLLIDNSPGITRRIVSLCLASRELFIVTTPEAAAITDAYALLKVLSANGLWRKPHLLVNRASGPRQARQVFDRISRTAAQHLGLTCAFAGHIPDDVAVSRAAALRKPLQDVAPSSAAALAFMALARGLVLTEGRLKQIARAPADVLRDFLVKLRESGDVADTPRMERVVPAAELVAGTGLLKRLEAFSESAYLLSRRVGQPDVRAELARLGAEATALRAEISAHVGNKGLAPRRPSGPERIVLACDDPAMHDLLAEIVQGLGFAPTDVHEAASATDAAQTPPVMLVVFGNPAHIEERLSAGLLEKLPCVHVEGFGTTPLDQGPGRWNVTVTLRQPFRLDAFRNAILETASRLSRAN